MLRPATERTCSRVDGAGFQISLRPSMGVAARRYRQADAAYRQNARRRVVRRLQRGNTALGLRDFAPPSFLGRRRLVAGLAREAARDSLSASLQPIAFTRESSLPRVRFRRGRRRRTCWARSAVDCFWRVAAVSLRCRARASPPAWPLPQVRQRNVPRSRRRRRAHSPPIRYSPIGRAAIARILMLPAEHAPALRHFAHQATADTPARMKRPRPAAMAIAE